MKIYYHAGLKKHVREDEGFTIAGVRSVPGWLRHASQEQILARGFVQVVTQTAKRDPDYWVEAGEVLDELVRTVTYAPRDLQTVKDESRARIDADAGTTRMSYLPGAGVEQEYLLTETQAREWVAAYNEAVIQPEVALPAPPASVADWADAAQKEPMEAANEIILKADQLKYVLSLIRGIRLKAKALVDASISVEEVENIVNGCKADLSNLKDTSGS